MACFLIVNLLCTHKTAFTACCLALCSASLAIGRRSYSKFILIKMSTLKQRHNNLSSGSDAFCRAWASTLLPPRRPCSVTIGGNFGHCHFRLTSTIGSQSASECRFLIIVPRRSQRMERRRNLSRHRRLRRDKWENSFRSVGFCLDSQMRTGPGVGWMIHRKYRNSTSGQVNPFLVVGPLKLHLQHPSATGRTGAEQYEYLLEALKPV